MTSKYEQFRRFVADVLLLHPDASTSDEALFQSWCEWAQLVRPPQNSWVNSAGALVELVRELYPSVRGYTALRGVGVRDDWIEKVQTSGTRRARRKHA